MAREYGVLLLLPVPPLVLDRCPDPALGLVWRVQVPNLQLICGGTGVAPMMQLLDIVLMNKNDSTKVKLLQAAHNEDQLFMLARLRQLQSSHERFTFQTILSFPNQTVGQHFSEVYAGLKGRIDADVIKRHVHVRKCPVSSAPVSRWLATAVVCAWDQADSTLLTA